MDIVVSRKFGHLTIAMKSIFFMYPAVYCISLYLLDLLESP